MRQSFCLLQSELLNVLCSVNTSNAICRLNVVQIKKTWVTFFTLGN